jgi:hypothetical protein
VGPEAPNGDEDKAATEIHADQVQVLARYITIKIAFTHGHELLAVSQERFEEDACSGK